MARMGGRSRARGGPGRLRWVALGGAAIVILGLTFGLGLLVGRQWGRHTPPAVTGEPTRKSAAGPRRGGLSEPTTDRAAARQEKLTFYQTLTAPLVGAIPLSGKTEAAPKHDAAAKPRPKSGASPERGQERAPPREDEPSLPSRAAAGASNLERPTREGQAPEANAEASGEWVVQVGVFKNSQQAERIRKQLADAGLAARVAPITADDGQLRYRVRVGAFKSKDEALKTAERIRSDRSLPTFVTAR
jgi:cell division protein FtsN